MQRKIDYKYGEYRKEGIRKERRVQKQVRKKVIGRQNPKEKLRGWRKWKEELYVTEE